MVLCRITFDGQYDHPFFSHLNSILRKFFSTSVIWMPSSYCRICTINKSLHLGPKLIIMKATEN
jgi:hypothetical protein